MMERLTEGQRPQVFHSFLMVKGLNLASVRLPLLGLIAVKGSGVIYWRCIEAARRRVFKHRISLGALFQGCLGPEGKTRRGDN